MSQIPNEDGLSQNVYDVAIVGAGLAGTLAAIVLGRKGYKIALIDRYATIPYQFRVEKIAGDQVDKLRRLDLIEALETAATPFDDIVNARHGRVLGHTRKTNYGVLYDSLTNAMRAALPASVDFVVGKVGDMSTSTSVQTISVSGQGTITARLAILATGLGDVLRRKLGIERKVIHEKQSLTFGFNIVPAGGKPLRYSALTYNGDQPSEAIDYLSLFPVGDQTRANLFTFLDHKDPRVDEMRKNPRAALTRAMPGLLSVLGDFDVQGKVEAWPVDLSVVDNGIQDGVVLIGDAYQTSCPAAGTGVSRILTDVEQLCTLHVPDWLESPGMAAEKIARFYQDRDKLAMDRQALSLAHYRRAFTTNTSVDWQLRRQLSYAKRRLLGLLDSTRPGSVETLRRVLSRPA